MLCLRQPDKHKDLINRTVGINWYLLGDTIWYFHIYMEDFRHIPSTATSTSYFSSHSLGWWQFIEVHKRALQIVRH